MGARTREQRLRYSAARREKRKENLAAVRAYERARKRKPGRRTPEQKAAYAAKKRAIRAADAERLREYDRQRRAAQAEKFRARDKRRYAQDDRKREANRRSRMKHAVRTREANARWRRENPQYILAANAKRRAQLRAVAVPLTHEEQAEVVAFYAKARALTELTGVPYHVDHIKPISKGGLHHPDNLQVLLGRENLKKGNKT